MASLPNPERHSNKRLPTDIRLERKMPGDVVLGPAFTEEEISLPQDSFVPRSAPIQQAITSVLPGIAGGGVEQEPDVQPVIKPQAPAVVPGITAQSATAEGVNAVDAENLPWLRSSKDMVGEAKESMSSISDETAALIGPQFSAVDQPELMTAEEKARLDEQASVQTMLNQPQTFSPYNIPSQPVQDVPPHIQAQLDAMIVKPDVAPQDAPVSFISGDSVLKTREAELRRKLKNRDYYNRFQADPKEKSDQSRVGLQESRTNGDANQYLIQQHEYVSAMNEVLQQEGQERVPSDLEKMLAMADLAEKYDADLSFMERIGPDVPYSVVHARMATALGEKLTKDEEYKRRYKELLDQGYGPVSANAALVPVMAVEALSGVRSTTIDMLAGTTRLGNLVLGELAGKGFQLFGQEAAEGVKGEIKRSGRDSADWMGGFRPDPEAQRELKKFLVGEGITDWAEGGTVEQIGSGLGSTVPYIVFAAMPGGKAGFAAKAFIAGGGNAERVYQEGRRLGLSDEEALVPALMSAPAGALEMIGPQLIMSKVPSFSRLFNALDEPAKNSFIAAIGKGTGTVAVDAFTEALQEMTTDAINYNILDQFVEQTDDLYDQLQKSGEIGGWVGGLMSAARRIVGIRRGAGDILASKREAKVQKEFGDFIQKIKPSLDRANKDPKAAAELSKLDSKKQTHRVAKFQEITPEIAETIDRFESMYGVAVIPYSAVSRQTGNVNRSESAKGFIINGKDGRIYLDVKGYLNQQNKAPVVMAHSTLEHEFLHVSDDVDNELYSEMVKAVEEADPDGVAKAANDYVQLYKLENGEEPSQEKIDKEKIEYYRERSIQGGAPSVLELTARRNPSNARKLLKAITNFLKKLRAWASRRPAKAESPTAAARRIQLEFMESQAAKILTELRGGADVVQTGDGFYAVSYEADSEQITVEIEAENENQAIIEALADRGNVELAQELRRVRAEEAKEARRQKDFADAQEYIASPYEMDAQADAMERLNKINQIKAKRAREREIEALKDVGIADDTDQQAEEIQKEADRADRARRIQEDVAAAEKIKDDEARIDAALDRMEKKIESIPIPARHLFLSDRQDSIENVQESLSSGNPDVVEAAVTALDRSIINWQKNNPARRIKRRVEELKKTATPSQLEQLKTDEEKLAEYKDIGEQIREAEAIESEIRPEPVLNQDTQVAMDEASREIDSAERPLPEVSQNAQVAADEAAAQREYLDDLREYRKDSKEIDRLSNEAEMLIDAIPMPARRLFLDDNQDLMSDLYAAYKTNSPEIISDAVQKVRDTIKSWSRRNPPRRVKSRVDKIKKTASPAVVEQYKTKAEKMEEFRIAGEQVRAERELANMSNYKKRKKVKAAKERARLAEQAKADARAKREGQESKESPEPRKRTRRKKPQWTPPAESAETVTPSQSQAEESVSEPTPTPEPTPEPEAVTEPQTDVTSEVQPDVEPEPGLGVANEVAEETYQVSSRSEIPEGASNIRESVNDFGDQVYEFEYKADFEPDVVDVQEDVTLEPEPEVRAETPVEEKPKPKKKRTRRKKAKTVQPKPLVDQKNQEENPGTVTPENVMDKEDILGGFSAEEAAKAIFSIRGRDLAPEQENRVRQMLEVPGVAEQLEILVDAQIGLEDSSNVAEESVPAEPEQEPEQEVEDDPNPAPEFVGPFQPTADFSDAVVEAAIEEARQRQAAGLESRPNVPDSELVQRLKYAMTEQGRLSLLAHAATVPDKGLKTKEEREASKQRKIAEKTALARVIARGEDVEDGQSEGRDRLAIRREANPAFDRLVELYSRTGDGIPSFMEPLEGVDPSRLDDVTLEEEQALDRKLLDMVKETGKGEPRKSLPNPYGLSEEADTMVEGEIKKMIENTRDGDPRYSLPEMNLVEDAYDVTRPTMTNGNGNSLPDRIMVDGQARSTRDNKGRVIHSTRRGVENFWRNMGDTVLLDSEGRPMVLYHGTTHYRDMFRGKESPYADHNGYYGGNIYLTDSTLDVNDNYAGIGPDLQGKIDDWIEKHFYDIDFMEDWERENLILDYLNREDNIEHFKEYLQVNKLPTQTLEQQLESDLDGLWDEFGGSAMEQMAIDAKVGKQKEGIVYPVYARLTNPFDTTSDRILSQEESQRLYDAAMNNTERGDYDDMIDLVEGGGTAMQWDRALREYLYDYGIYDPDESSPEHLLTEVLEEAGYNGVIMDASKAFGPKSNRFRKMAMDPETTHVIMFNGRNIKSAIGNRGTYDTSEQELLKSLPERNRLKQTQELIDELANRAGTFRKKKGEGKWGALLDAVGRQTMGRLPNSWQSFISGKVDDNYDRMKQVFEGTRNLALLDVDQALKKYDLRAATPEEERQIFYAMTGSVPLEEVQNESYREFAREMRGIQEIASRAVAEEQRLAGNDRLAEVIEKNLGKYLYDSIPKDVKKKWDKEDKRGINGMKINTSQFMAKRDQFILQYVLNGSTINYKLGNSRLGIESQEEVDELVRTLDAVRKGVEDFEGYKYTAEELPPELFELAQRKKKYKIIEPLTEQERIEMGFDRNPQTAAIRSVFMTAMNANRLRFFRQVSEQYGMDFSSNESAQDQGYLRIPDSEKYGALAGKYVPENIQRDIVASFAVRDGIFAAAEEYLKMWKASKTLYNPSTHLRNLYGNMIFALFDDPVGVPLHMLQAIKSIKNKDRFYRELLRNNVIGGGDISRDYGVAMDKALHKLDGSWGGVMGAFRQIHNAVGSAYNVEDHIFKLASYIAKRNQGYSEADAVDLVNRWYPNYSKTGRLAQNAARYALGGPFTMFLDQSIRIAGRAIRYKPVTLMAVTGIPAMLTMLSNLIEGDDEDERYARDRNRSYFEPPIPGWVDSKGRQVTMDLRWIIPLANDIPFLENALAGAEQAIGIREASPNLDIPHLGFFGQMPVVGGGLELLYNRNTFTGQPLVGKDDSYTEALATRGIHMITDAAPIPTFISYGPSRFARSGVIPGISPVRMEEGLTAQELGIRDNTSKTYFTVYGATGSDVEFLKSRGAKPYKDGWVIPTTRKGEKTGTNRDEVERVLRGRWSDKASTIRNLYSSVMGSSLESEYSAWGAAANTILGLNFKVPPVFNADMYDRMNEAMLEDPKIKKMLAEYLEVPERELNRKGVLRKMEHSERLSALAEAFRTQYYRNAAKRFTSEDAVFRLGKQRDLDELDLQE